MGLRHEQKKRLVGNHSHEAFEENPPVTEGSRQTVTQHDRFANPKSAASIVHIKGTTALHKAYKTAAYEKLSTGARALYTFICLKSGKYGCVFFRMDKIAKATGIGRRILCLKRAELEAAGWIVTNYVPRGNALPSGQIASRQTAIFHAQVPINPLPLEPINDPAMLIIDPTINDQGGLSPFCDLLDLEEDPDVGLPSIKPQRATAPVLPLEPLEPLSLRILQQWQTRLMPSLAIDPETGRSWLSIIKARLRDGFTETQCYAAIEAHYRSPHNRPASRRTVHHVFADPERLLRMAELGASTPLPITLKKVSLPPSALGVTVPENPTPDEIEAIYETLNRRQRTEEVERV